MTKRSNRLRLVVKESGKTAKEIINKFDKMETNNRGGSLNLPSDPVTISRHINAKRGFDIDMAVAYGKALDADPADICFEPVIKNIRGYVDPFDSKKPFSVNWYTNKEDGIYEKEILSVRVPRDFYADKFRLVEFKNPTSYRHGVIIIYQKSKNDNKKFANPRNFNQFCMCEIPISNKSVESDYIVGIPIPTKNNDFIIANLEGGILKSNTKIINLHPIVSMVTAAFYENYLEN